MTTPARDCLVRLNQMEGLGSATIHRLLKATQAPEEIFQLSRDAIRQILGHFATEEVLRQIERVPSGEEVKKEYQRAQETGVTVVTILDCDYPKLLKEIPDPPPVLYVKGTLMEEDLAAVAMVGTRLPSPYGLYVARTLGGELASSGLTIVSGLAQGIDAASHEGALEKGGRTIAVLRHGLSHLYPPGHRKLGLRIAQSGPLISEFPMEFPPIPSNFPRRNRVISGLSLGVIVVEAPRKSGALITAQEAMEQGREVFAVPGPVSSAKSRGCHQLIRDGAKLVETPLDVLEELTPYLKDQIGLWKRKRSPEMEAGIAARVGWTHSSVLTREESLLYEVIPVGTAAVVDSLVEKIDMTPSRLLPLLTTLELKGLVHQIPGQGYSRVS